MKASELLDKAADHIEQYGLERDGWVEATWDDYSPAPRECAACAGGALAIHLSGGRYFSPNFIELRSNRDTLDAATDYIVQYLGLPTRRAYANLDAVIEWNDASTQDEVVAGLRGAADLARTEGS